MFSLYESLYFYRHYRHFLVQKDSLNDHNTMIVSIMQLFLCFYQKMRNPFATGSLLSQTNHDVLLENLLISCEYLTINHYQSKEIAK